MRKALAAVLTGLGACLVVVALLAQFWAPGQLMRIPADVESVTRLAGNAELSDGVGGTTPTEVRATSVTLADTGRSDDDVLSVSSSQCLFKAGDDIDQCIDSDDPQGRLISASTEEFAVDRKTSMAVGEAKYLPPTGVVREGLTIKFPFDAEKTTYPYWDGMVGEAVDAVYSRTETVDGVEVYVYEVNVVDAPAEISGGIQGTYSSDKELWVEPVTGQYVNQIDHQERFAADGSPFLILDLAMTDEQVATNAEETSATASRLNLIRSTVPIIGWVGGICLLLVGGLLILLRRRSPSGS